MDSQHEHSAQPTATEVVHQYESLREQGEDITPEQLCEKMGCPNLLEEVIRHLRDLEAMKRFLKSSSTAVFTSVAGQDQAATVGWIELPQLDQYEAREIIGHGGFGLVWRARDVELHRDVAIKVPRPDHHFTESQVNQFVQEARRAASLNHPHIVKVFQVKRLGKTCLIISEFINGRSLKDLLEEREFSPEEAAGIVAAIAEALHHAHLKGLVHRDVKPGNILVNEALKPYLTDFGLAVTEEEQLDEPALILGTVTYMSPEQARGESHRVDARADIYSLGVVLYQLLTRRRPFLARTREEYIDQVLHRHPRTPRTINEAIPAELERICLKCLAKPVAERYTTAADLAKELRDWLSKKGKGSRPPASWKRRLPLMAALGGMLAVGLVGVWLVVNAPPDPHKLPNGGRKAPEAQLPKGDKQPAKNGGGVALAMEPEALVQELVWPRERELCSWKILPANNSLRVYTDRMSLLQLGEITTDCKEVSMDIRQLNWTGDVGVFLAFRKRGPTGKAHFERLALGRSVKGYVVQRADCFFLWEKRFSGPGSMNLGSVARMEQQELTRLRLTLRLQDGKLQSVLVNGKPRTELTAGLEDRDCTGPFGVYNFHSDGVFSQIAINHKPIVLKSHSVVEE